MVLDLIENLKSYEALNPHFSKVVDFLEKNNLADLPLGRNEICGDTVYANVMEAPVKSQEEAFIEVHRRYIDIQIPVSSDELMGYTPLTELPQTDYNADSDAAIYPVGMPARDYFNVHKGEFVIFFPQDGHAPAITAVPLKKVVFKVAVE
ncbi:MAG: YhcH/YjgK/YiaL family protein [Bacteroidaceae bacterium]|jgi:YhcH/YjgK/YiaL family protein|nr:YhcH/YjgK/YiaL family protein [Bacteroidaceae bacterium]